MLHLLIYRAVVSNIPLEAVRYWAPKAVWYRNSITLHFTSCLWSNFIAEMFYWVVEVDYYSKETDTKISIKVKFNQ